MTQAKRLDALQLIFDLRQLEAQGDTRAARRLPRLIQSFAEANLPLAYYYASKWRTPKIPHDDLRQQAVIGLLEAIHKWTPGHGFTSFAIIRMRFSIQRFIEKKLPAVHVPQNVWADRRRILKALRSQPDLSDDDLVAVTGLSIDRIHHVQEAYFGLGWKSLSQPE